MNKPEFEFFPVSHIDWTPLLDSRCGGLSERILATDPISGVSTRMLRFAPGTDTTPNSVLTHDFREEVYILDGNPARSDPGADLHRGHVRLPPAWHASRPVEFAAGLPYLRSPSPRLTARPRAG